MPDWQVALLMLAICMIGAIPVCVDRWCEAIELNREAYLLTLLPEERESGHIWRMVIHHVRDADHARMEARKIGGHRWTPATIQVERLSKNDQLVPITQTIP